ncbi:LeuB [Caligus rogercresseyi]|uniref:LeuB n=1 Tax=Caligus rogercresseyi TaxID=217165 RepID=A0A7T8HMH7_CALRO|nr:LeuB [Caligus rogercresseyi]
MITKHLGELPLGLYAADRYITRHGTPQTAEALRDHQMVGYDRSDLILRGMREMGMEVTRDWFTTCTDDQVAYWNFVAAGCGIGIGQTVVADRTPGLRRILPDLPVPPLPVWLTAHPSLRHQPRVAAVWTALDRAITPCFLDAPKRRATASATLSDKDQTHDRPFPSYPSRRRHGPEVMAEVRKVIDWFGTARGIEVDVSEDLVGGAAYDAHGVPLADATMEKAQSVDAVCWGRRWACL